MKVGIFGGTFDPPHLGHRMVGVEVAETLGLERMLWIPSGNPPHKRDPHPTPAETRLEMVRETVRDDPGVAVSTLEIERPGPSYTVDTIRDLLADHPDWEIFLIVGSDQFEGFDRWKDPRTIVELCTLAVMRRAGSPESPSSTGRKFSHRIVPTRAVELSSSEIRGRIRSGRPVRHLVRTGVWEIIEREGLYR